MDDARLAAMLAAMPTVQDGDSPRGLITCPVRLAFPHIDKPSQQKGATNKPPRYSLLAIVPPAADLALFKAACAAAWKDTQANKAPKSNPLKPQADMLAREYEGFSDNGICFNAESNAQPAVIGPDAKPFDPTRIYPGCWARVKVWAAGYDVAGNWGVKFWLQCVQFLADDTKFSAAGDPAAGFTPFAGGAAQRAAAANGGAAMPAASAEKWF